MPSAEKAADSNFGENWSAEIAACGVEGLALRSGLRSQLAFFLAAVVEQESRPAVRAFPRIETEDRQDPLLKETGASRSEDMLGTAIGTLHFRFLP